MQRHNVAKRPNKEGLHRAGKRSRTCSAGRRSISRKVVRQRWPRRMESDAACLLCLSGRPFAGREEPMEERRQRLEQSSSYSNPGDG